MSKDFFSQKSNAYDQDSCRVSNVDNIAQAILNRVTFNTEMEIMDFGSGTGLLLEKIAPFVKSITAVDISESMNEQLIKKHSILPCKLEVMQLDLTTTDFDQKFDGIISSMTLHHIKNPNTLFAKFHSLLNDGGFIAIADLETEDGSFHTEDTGVHHYGFSKEKFTEYASDAGFQSIEVMQASIARKPHGDYLILLLSALK